MDVIINGQAEAVNVSTVSPHLQRLGSSPRANIHSLTPHADTAAWTHAVAAAPRWLPRDVSVGINLESNTQKWGMMPYEGIGFPYPAYVTYGDRSHEFAYALTKAVVINHEKITAALKNVDG